MTRLVVSMIAAAMFMVSGCRFIEPEPVSQLPMTIPDAFSGRTGEVQPTPGKEAPIREWWRALDSEELNGLMARGLAGNYDLKVRKARVEQARASLEKEKAAVKPGLDFSLGGQKRHTRTKTSPGQGALSNWGHSWDGSLTGSYTVDAWGQASAAIRAKALDLEAAGQDLNDAALELTSDIAKTWVEIISVRERKTVLENQIKVNETHFELQKLRFLNGRASALDVSQQREALAQALSLVPLLEKEEKQFINTLAFLMGEVRGQGLGISTQALPRVVFPADLGIPADLLENRADIRAARMRLLASQSEVDEAKADMLPSFTLSASALFSSGTLDLLFQNWVAALGASIAGPVFDGGLRKAEVERTRAIVDEQLNLYARAVASAIREVEDSLVAIDRQREYIKLLEQELDAVGLTLKDARVQYLNGQSSYLNYLAAWSGIERLERQLVSERAVYAKERITLHRVIGWQAPVTENESQISGAN